MYRYICYYNINKRTTTRQATGREGKKMTFEKLVKRLKRLEKGEYYCGDIEALFLKVANKSEYIVNPLTGDKFSKLYPTIEFSQCFDECKFGLEYATNGKMRYIGTNDIDTLIIS